MTHSNDDIFSKISLALQNIQDCVISGTKGLDRHEIKNHVVFWELGLLVQKFLNSHSISEDYEQDELEKNFRNMEKKIRSVGKRKGKDDLPSWKYKNNLVKPPKMQEPAITWISVSWDFVKEYQDMERWNLVANLSGDQYPEGFVRKRAEELIPYFSKLRPPKNAKIKQEKFIKEMSKFEKNPSRKMFGTENKAEGLIPLIFGKLKINLSLSKELFFQISSEVNQLINDEYGTMESRKKYAKEIGLADIDSFRRLLRLLSITDENKFESRLKKLGKISPSIKTKHHDSKTLYAILFSMIKDADSRKKFLERISKHDLSLLNTKLFAISSEESFLEYREDQKSRESLFK
jgi:hypothetical protein